VEEVAVPERTADGSVRMLTGVRVESGRVLDGPGVERLAHVLERG
jgi:hypothetical protein